jgi:phage terminase large subunit-like protein
VDDVVIDEALVQDLAAAETAYTQHRQKWLYDAWHRERPEWYGKQLPPELTRQGVPWSIVLWRAGRGFGKTKAEGEWLFSECWRQPNMIGHYLAATIGDVLGTLFLGPAGLQAIIPPECLKGGSWEIAFNKNDKIVKLATGGYIRGFPTTEEGDRLRGPQCHRLAGDELAAWDRPAGNAEAAFDNAMLGCRLKSPDGSPAQAVFGTTPKPIAFMKKLERREDVIVVRGSTYENLSNLDANFRRTVLSKEGTQIGKQEIYGDYIDDEMGGIIKRSWFRLWPRGKKLPEFSFILISFDTAFEEENYDWDRVKREIKVDYSAATVWGVFNTKQCFTPEELRRMQVKTKYAAVLCDCWAERYGFPDLLEKARAMHRQRWGQTPGRKADMVLIEAKASGISLRQSLVKYGIPTWPYNPGNQSKTMRVHAASPYIKQGGLFVPESMAEERRGQPRDWVEPFLEQVCTFQGEGSIPFDDYVDSLSQAVIYLGDHSLLTIGPQEQPDPDPDETKAIEEREAQAEKDRQRSRVNPYGS